MRALIPIAGAALALSGCGQDQAAENIANVEAAATAEDIGSNDTTAIDAATSDAANMAADVDFTVEEDGNASNDAGDSTATSPRRVVRPSPAEDPNDDAGDTGNAAENAE